MTANKEKLRIDLDRVGQWAVDNATKINPGKITAVNFTRDRVKETLNYFLGDQRIPEAICCRYLRINLHSDVSWADQVNYTMRIISYYTVSCNII